jgi:hypothetical protein
MAKNVFNDNPNSKYGTDLIAKEVHDFYGQAIRTIDTRSLVSRYFTHFRAKYDNSSRPIEVTYYRGMKSHSTEFEVNAVHLLSGTYFILRSCPNNDLWVVWYNVDNTSVRPSVANAKYIEIEISSTDSEQLVALATALTINSLYKNHFTVTRNGKHLQILTTGLGEVEPSEERTVPFMFEQKNGEQELVQKIEIEYQGNDPVYNGQVLKKHRFNIFDGKFELNEVSNDAEWDAITTTFPSSTSELYTYTLSGDTVQTVLVTYQDTTKQQIISVQKSRL